MFKNKDLRTPVKVMGEIGRILRNAPTSRFGSTSQKMNDESPSSDYLVISRGHGDADASQQQIQEAIDRFCNWHARRVGEGKMKGGQRLAREGKLVPKHAVLDGPFAEAKEVIGGYWFITARSLTEAARIAAQNPCLAFGLAFEIRPIEAARASAFALASETPARRQT